MKPRICLDLPQRRLCSRRWKHITNVPLNRRHREWSYPKRAHSDSVMTRAAMVVVAGCDAFLSAHSLTEFDCAGQGERRMR